MAVLCNTNYKLKMLFNVHRRIGQWENSDMQIHNGKFFIVLISSLGIYIVSVYLFVIYIFILYDTLDLICQPSFYIYNL